MPRRKKTSTTCMHKLGSWALGEANLIPISDTPPDDPDHESILALSEGSETSPEDNMDLESDIESIKASMKDFYQVFHPHQRCTHLLEAERAKVSSLLLPLILAHHFIAEAKDWVTSTCIHRQLGEIGSMQESQQPCKGSVCPGL
jgi:hypothetical protein